MKKYIGIFLLISGVVCPDILLALEPPKAAGRLHFGNYSILPGVTVVEQYDDNIYLGNGKNKTSELEESDGITHLQPQLLTQIAFPGRGYAGVGYKGDYAYYSDYDSNNWQSHTGVVELDYESPAGLIAGGRHMYADTEDPYGSDIEYKSGVPLTARETHTSKWRLGFATPELLKFLVYYNFYNQDYDNDILDYSQDYEDNEFGCGLRVRAASKTWAFVRWFRGFRDYYTHLVPGPVTEANDADYEWQRVNFGLLWESGGRLSGELNVGYKDVDYDHETAGAAGAEYDDRDTWVAATSITYRLARQTRVTLDVSNDLRQVGANTSNYYEDTRVGLNFGHVFLEKMKVQAGITYRQWDYYRFSRDEDDYIASLDVDYSVRPWLTVGAGYFYKEKQSDSKSLADNYGEIHEYTVNRYVLRLSAVF